MHVATVLACLLLQTSALTLPPTFGELVCHSISDSVSDAWCTANCNHVPVNCPADQCECAPAPPPAPTPFGPPSNFPGPIFELDLFINDPDKGYQPTGFPEYLQHSAANYTNVAGISFIQPADLLDDDYDLPAQVADVVQVLRKQGVAVQLLVGGEISAGWEQLAADPAKAATKAIALMKKYSCGIEVDDEAGGSDATGLIKFIELCAQGKPNGTYISMDVGGTPDGLQKGIIAGAIDSLDWVNLMVSAPSYDQGLSVKYGHEDGIPFNKILVAYYAGTWVDNCNSVGSPDNNGDTAAGIALFEQNGLKGLSIWAVGGASYSNCGSSDAPGFRQAMMQLGIER